MFLDIWALLPTRRCDGRPSGGAISCPRRDTPCSTFSAAAIPAKCQAIFSRAALYLDYPTAVRANITKQDYGVCPRHWYVDGAFRCVRCGKNFIFPAEEQRFWYEELGFYIDSRAKGCRGCRSELRDLKLLQQEYDREISAPLKSASELGRKKRLIDVINALDEGGVELPDKTEENRRILVKQITRIGGG